jgi:hypothetical protein
VGHEGDVLPCPIWLVRGPVVDEVLSHDVRGDDFTQNNSANRNEFARIEPNQAAVLIENLCRFGDGVGECV